MPPRVLCVGDDADAIWTTAVLLEMAGCEVWVSADGPTALAKARAFRPDVCVVDLNLPGMSGAELGTRLRAEAGDRPPRLVALTGAWDAGGTLRTCNAGFSAHLVKPADPCLVVDAVLGDLMAGT